MTKAHKLILFTGTHPKNYESSGQLIHWPMIHIEKASIETECMKSLMDEMDHFDMILFTSRYAVKYFFESFEQQGFPLTRFKTKKLIVIGQHTADVLQEAGFKPALVSDVEDSEGLLEAMTTQYDLRDKKILFPRSSLPNLYLQKQLEKKGAHVTVLTVYQNTKPPKRALPKESITDIIFTSPSTAKNFLEDYGTIPQGWNIHSKGPLTQRFLKEAGYNSDVLEHESS